jgi:endonuclease/exonuclease/phosphatase family metal-dependent hydrolase
MKRSLLRSIVYGIVLAINGIALIGLMASYLAGSISPADFWPLAFAGLAYPVMLAIALIFALFWAIRRKWKLLLFHLFILGIRADLVAAHIQIGNRNADLPIENGINVMTYNVHLFSAYRELDNRQELHSMVDHITAESTDIICMQEYFSQGEKNRPEIKDDLKKLSLGRHSHIEAYAGSPGTPYTSGVALATLSSYPVLARGRILATNSAAMRCIYTDLLIAQDTIRVYNVHLESVRIQDADFQTLNQVLTEMDSLERLSNIFAKLRNAFVNRAELSDSMVAHMARCPFPVIVCGDFNDTPASYSYQRISRSLKDSFREAGKGSGFTYARVPLFRIDNILYSNSFRARSHSVHQWPHSDHYAVTAVIVRR